MWLYETWMLQWALLLDCLVIARRLTILDILYSSQNWAFYLDSFLFCFGDIDWTVARKLHEVSLIERLVLSFERRCADNEFVLRFKLCHPLAEYVRLEEFFASCGSKEGNWRVHERGRLINDLWSLSFKLLEVVAVCWTAKERHLIDSRTVRISFDRLVGWTSPLEEVPLVVRSSNMQWVELPL